MIQLLFGLFIQYNITSGQLFGYKPHFWPHSRALLQKNIKELNATNLSDSYTVMTCIGRKFGFEN